MDIAGSHVNCFQNTYTKRRRKVGFAVLEGSSMPNDGKSTHEASVFLIGIT